MNDELNKKISFEDLANFSEQVLLPAIESLMDDKFANFSVEVDKKLDQRFADFSKEMDYKLDKRFADADGRMDEKLMLLNLEVQAIKKDLASLMIRVAEARRAGNEDVGVLSGCYIQLKRRVERIEMQLKQKMNAECPF